MRREKEGACSICLMCLAKEQFCDATPLPFTFQHLGKSRQKHGSVSTFTRTAVGIFLAFMSELLRRTADLLNEAESTSRSLKTHITILQTQMRVDEVRFGPRGPGLWFEDA